MRPDERSDAWGVCHELAVAVYRVTDDWPSREIYGLAVQARRAAFIAALCLADDPLIEDREQPRRRVGRALASLNRLQYVLMLARELGYLTPDGWQALGKLRHRAEELTYSLHTSMNTPPRLLR